MKPIVDSVEPKEKVQILLIKKGQRVAGIHLEEGKEIRSPSLNKGSTDVDIKER